MTKSSSITFYMRLNALLVASGLSVTNFAKKIGVSRQMTTNYLDGKAIPHIRTLKKIAEACSVSTDFLLGMDDSDEKDVCKLALKHYGAESQTRMMFEEIAELQKELCKHARGAENKEQIAEEIADVEIVLEQMKILHDVADLSECFKRTKLERLRKRIDVELEANNGNRFCF